jgi:hypothetical protein
MKMELTFNEAQVRSNILKFIPKNKVSQATRIKLIRYEVALEKLLKSVSDDVQEGIKKIKPEGFDERFQKYAEAIEGKDTDLAKEQEQSEGYAEFKEEFEKVNSEFSELQKKFLQENKTETNIPAFTDDDLLDILQALPSGETVEVKQNEQDLNISNDEIVKSFVSIFE